MCQKKVLDRMTSHHVSSRFVKVLYGNLIFNKFLREGGFPQIWNLARPIHKLGDKCHVDNYRPIPQVSSISKL